RARLRRAKSRTPIPNPNHYPNLGSRRGIRITIKIRIRRSPPRLDGVSPSRRRSRLFPRGRPARDTLFGREPEGVTTDPGGRDSVEPSPALLFLILIIILILISETGGRIRITITIKIR